MILMYTKSFEIQINGLRQGHSLLHNLSLITSQPDILKPFQKYKS